MRKAVIASDSFKGSLSSSQVADAASTGIRETYPDCLIDTISVADGGEGMVEALKKEMHLETRQLKVHDPLGRLTDASYGIGKSSEGLTAVIEMAEASGYTLAEAPYQSAFAGYKDWFIQYFRRPGYTIEVGEGENPLPLSQFDEIYRRNLGILTAAATDLPG